MTYAGKSDGGFKLTNDEYWVLCPYDLSHILTNFRISIHIGKCRKNYISAKKAKGETVFYKQCRYNYLHRFPEPEVEWHEQRCPCKEDIARHVALVASSSSSSSSVPQPEGEEMESEADIDIDIEEEEKYWTELREIPQPGVKRKNDKGVYSEDEAEGRGPARKLTPLELDFAKLVVNDEGYYFDELTFTSDKSSDIDIGSDCPDGKFAQPCHVLGGARQSSHRRIKMARRQTGDKNTNNAETYTDNPFQMQKRCEPSPKFPPEEDWAAEASHNRKDPFDPTVKLQQERPCVPKHLLTHSERREFKEFNRQLKNDLYPENAVEPFRKNNSRIPPPETRSGGQRNYGFDPSPSEHDSETSD